MEWENEPDKVDFEYKTLPCAMRRNLGGALCGYVGIPDRHPLFKVKYFDSSEELVILRDAMLEEPMPDNPNFSLMLGALSGEIKPRPDTVFQVHGGLTYSAVGDWPQEGDYWWFGFDCAHLGDYSPKYDKHFSDSIYRNLNYVKNQTEQLAEQLLRMVA